VRGKHDEVNIDNLAPLFKFFKPIEGHWVRLHKGTETTTGNLVLN